MIVTVRTMGIALVCAVVATVAAAQGKSGSAPGQNKTASPATSVSATSAPSTSANSSLYYGSWLDDASIMAPHTAWVGVSSAYWRSNVGHQIDAPVMMGAIGISPRAQIGATLLIYHFHDLSGSSASGVGTVSAYGKLMLVDPAGRNGVGLAIAPLVELAPGSNQRFGWALPVNVEARMRGMRLYGSTGYFSRGSGFAAIAAEIPTGRRASLTGNFGQSFASGSRETDLGVGVALSASPHASIFFNLGRAFMSDPSAAGGTSLGGGISFTLPHSAAHP